METTKVDRARRRAHLLSYYEQELTFIRRMLAEFAESYPDKAGKLLIDEDSCGDPHVERLIESVAVLTARTRMKLDETYPRITDSLLGILQPQLMAPVPPVTVAQFELSESQNDASEAYHIPRGTSLDSLHATDIKCKFRTSAALDLWPLEVVEVAVESPSEQMLARLGTVKARGALRIRLRTRGGQSFSGLGIDRLAFYLDCEDLAFTLLERLVGDAAGVLLGWGGWEREGGLELLGREAVRHVGFRRDEALLEYPLGAFQGYRFLQEFFCFPRKFLFVEYSGLDKGRDTAETDTLDLVALTERPLLDFARQVRPEHFKLGCVPVINLFEGFADPEVLKLDVVEHLIVPEARRKSCYEVHSVLEVQSTSVKTDEVRTYAPFFALRHGDGDADEVAFWHAERMESNVRGDRGTEVHVTLVDPKGMPMLTHERHVLVVRGLFFNRDVAAKLPYKHERGDLRVEGKPEVSRITCLHKPTETLRPELRASSQWSVVSSLALNHLSLVGDPEDPGRGLAAFKEILRAHDFVDDERTRKRREGLVGMRTGPVTRRIPGRGAARGLQIELEFEESAYVGSGAYLFAAVLERFLAAYTSINSFTQCIARLRGVEGILEAWPPRTGEQVYA